MMNHLYHVHVHVISMTLCMGICAVSANLEDAL